MLDKSYMPKFIILLCIPVLFVIMESCSRNAVTNVENDRIIGVKIYSANDELPVLFEQWKDLVEFEVIPVVSSDEAARAMLHPGRTPR